MKKFVLSLLLLSIAVSGFSQILYSENFENLAPGSFATGWLRYNVDGGTPDPSVAYINDAWIAREDFVSPNASDTCAFSTSYNVPVVQAEDWMVSPAIVMPVAGTPTLNWRAMAPDAGYPDGYNVVIATGNDLASLQSGSVVFSTAGEASVWTNHSVALGAFLGQTIYVAFVNNSNDMFLLMVDDIVVNGNLANNIAASGSPVPSQYTSIPLDQVSPIAMEGDVTNIGVADALNVYFDFAVSADAVNVYNTTSITVPTISSGNTVSFSAGSYTPTIVGQYVIDATANMQDPDLDPSDNSFSSRFNVDAQLYARDYEVIDNIVDGHISIGAGPGFNSVMGTIYDCVSPSTVQSVQFYLSEPVAGDVIEGRVYSVSGGLPDAILGQTAPYTIQPSDTLGVLLTLPLLSPVAVSPGQFFVAITEDANTVTLGVTLDKFTPNTFLVNWDTNPFGNWTGVEYFGPTFARAFILRALLAPTCSATITGGVPQCNSGDVYTAVHDGVAPFTYAWSTGETTASITPSVTGIYSVTVTDSNGCSAEATEVATIGEWRFVGALEAGDNIQVGRLTRDAIASTCASPKSCPGVFDNSGDRYYDVYTVSNTDPNNATCVTVGYYNSCGTNVFVTAYSSFDVNDICLNYLADAGSSLQSGSFEVSIPAGSSINIVAHTIDPNSSCGDYVLTVDQDFPQPNYTYSPSEYICGGSPVVITSSLATSYLWSTGETTQSITSNVSGLYGLTATYGNIGCGFIGAPELIDLPLPTVSIDGGGNYCTGTPSVQLSAISPDLVSYLWNTGETTSTIIVTAGGIYEVTVTTPSGCTAAANTSVLFGDYIFSGGLAAGDNIQVGRLTRDAVPSSCGAPKTCPGVFDPSGDRYYDVHTVTNPDPDNAVCATITTINSCGTSNFVLAYTTPYNPADLCQNYLADAGSSISPVSFTVTIPAGGSIDLVAHAVNPGEECFSYVISVDMPRPASPVVAFPAVVTCNEPITLTATTTTSYLWNTGETTQSITVNTSGSYTVTNQWGNGFCTSDASLEVTINPAPAVSISGNLVACAGGTVTLTASGGDSFLWSNGETTASIAVGAGFYSVVGTDANGCTGSAFVNVTESDLSGSISKLDAPCGNNDGLGNFDALGGTPGYTYLWSNGTTDEIATGLAPGTYTATVTDANGCTASASVTILVFPDINAPSITCPATQSLNGLLDATLPDYSGMATASDDCGSVTVSQTFPAPGTVYNTSQTVTVTLMATDGSGNMSTCIFDVNVNIGGCNFSTSIDPANATVCPGNTTNLAATNGVSWSWSNGETNQSISAGAGTYLVTVTDALGCVATASATVTESDLSGSISKLDAPCGNNDGLGNFDALGGTPGYTYLWSNGTTDEIATGLAPGTYTATVTDANGCTASASVTILVFPDINAPSITCPATQSLNGLLDATLPDYSGMATASDDCGSVTVSQTFPAPGTVYNTSQTVTVNLMATDGSGNMSTCIFDVVVAIGGCNLTFNGIGDGTCAGESNGVATIIVSGGTAPYSYDFGFGGTTDNSLTGLAAGTYPCTVTDAQGCIIVASATVPEFTPPSASATATDATCNGANGMVDLTVTGGAGNNSYAWSNGGVTEDLSNLSAGTYDVTVTDANGCTATASVTVGNAPDTNAPSITCPATQTLNGVNAATLPDYSGMATASDDCGTATVTQTFPAPGTVYNTSQTVTVTLMATDGAGNMSTCIFDVVVAIGGNCPPTPGVIYVDDSATGANNGTSWADAFTSLQSALAVAVAGNNIWVAEGTYKPGVTRTVNFTMKPDVSLYGGFPNGGGCTLQDRDWVAYPTNLSGDIGIVGDGSDNSSRVVQCKNVGSNVTIDGFIIRDALSNSSGGGIGITGDNGTSSPNIVHCVVRENYAPAKGAGCYVYALNGGVANPSFRDCQFVANVSTTSDGAGLATLANTGGSINATVDVCSFENNNADLKGAAIANTSNALGAPVVMTIDSCTFLNNVAGTNGGGVWNYARGGGISDLFITNSYFSGNSAQNGSAVYCHALSSGTAINTDIQNCTFANNTSTGYGAVCNYSQTNGFSDLDIDDCAFTGNTSGNGGGNSNVAVSGGTAVLHTQRSWFEGNTGQGGGVMTHSTGTNSQAYTNLGNCILRGNSSPSLGGAASCSATTGGRSFLQLAFCTVYGNTAGTYGSTINNNAAASALFSTVNFVSSIAWNNTCLLPGGRDFRTTGLPASTYSQHSDLFLPTCADNNNGTGLFDCTNNTISADPMFVDAANGDFHLMAGSPVIDLGTGGGYLEDYDGNVRPVGNDYDMGAYEYQGPRPLARMAATNNVSLFPNPTTGLFTLQFEQAATGTIMITDLTGRVLLTKVIENNSSIIFDLGQFASGVYMVRFVGNEEIIVRNVVVGQ